MLHGSCIQHHPISRPCLGNSVGTFKCLATMKFWYDRRWNESCTPYIVLRQAPRFLRLRFNGLKSRPSMLDVGLGCSSLSFEDIC